MVIKLTLLACVLQEKETVLKLRNYEPLSDIPAERGEAPALQSLKLAEQERAALQADPAALGMGKLPTILICTLVASRAQPF